jgi:hypothetical protein
MVGEGQIGEPDRVVGKTDSFPHPETAIHFEKKDEIGRKP